MKKIFFLLCPLFFTAQTHRFIYSFQYKLDSLAKDLRTENMILDVNPSDVKFYPYSYAETDSLNLVRAEKNYRWDDHLPALIRPRDSFENTSLILLNDLFSVKSTDKINWKRSDEVKTEGQYTLQKATANFGGRKWIAWFSKNISLSEGPYKFRGLPGLIFEIEDERKNFIFKLIKSYKLSKTYEAKFLNSFMGKNPIAVSQKIIAKKQLELYSDPLKEIAESFKNNTNPDNTYYVYGVEIKSSDQLKRMADETRKRMKRENNPIEIDKAVKYPAE